LIYKKKRQNENILRTSTSGFQQSERFHEAQEGFHPAGFGREFDNHAIIAHIYDFGAELFREDRDGVEELVFVA
jgi:hypothetical protein